MEDLIKTFLEVINFPTVQNIPEGFFGNGTGLGCGNSDYSYGRGNGKGEGIGTGNIIGRANIIGIGSEYNQISENNLNGILSVDGRKIYIIDEIPTAIDNIKGNIAIGKILQADMSWKQCYIARVGNSFAHGETSHEAFKDATAKDLVDMPFAVKIKRFKERFPSLDDTAQVSEFYNWHNTLTGSCKMGRKHWLNEHGYNMDTDISTVRNFLEQTKNDYGSNVITKVLELYNC